MRQETKVALAVTATSLLLAAVTAYAWQVRRDRQRLIALGSGRRRSPSSEDEDGSARKLASQLGLESVEELESAQQQEAERRIELAAQKASRSISNRAASSKALKVLGADPQKEKLRQKLGLSRDELADAEEREARRRMEDAEKKVSRAIPNRRDMDKALKTLGIDPSRTKAQKIFGVDEQTMQEAEREAERVRDEPTAAVELGDVKQPSRNLPRDTHPKALKTLGVNPSLIKAQQKLGVDDLEMDAAHREAREHRSS